MKRPGDPDCSQCHGEGVLLHVVPEDDPDFGRHPPTFVRCGCTLRKDILANVERAMPGLTKAAKVEASRLGDWLDSNLWVTAEKEWFLSHLRHVAIRRPPTWFLHVTTDADLLTAWLASAKAEGKKILDVDVAQSTVTHLMLPDLAVPPALLVIRLGVKVARNVAAPEVFLEALRLREHLGKPTWIWDHPHWKLEEGHICYSRAVADHLSGWKHLLAKPRKRAQMVETADGGFTEMALEGRRTMSSGTERKTLRGSGGDDE
jgi:hypothetical protein